MILGDLWLLIPRHKNTLTSLIFFKTEGRMNDFFLLSLLYYYYFFGSDHYYIIWIQMSDCVPEAERSPKPGIWSEYESLKLPISDPSGPLVYFCPTDGLLSPLHNCSLCWPKKYCSLLIWTKDRWPINK